jgi:hypothetical protein
MLSSRAFQATEERRLSKANVDLLPEKRSQLRHEVAKMDAVRIANG